MRASDTALAIAAAVSAVGASAIVAPRWASRRFGIPADDAAALAFVRACGARDVVVGCALAAVRERPDAVRRFLAAIAPLALADALIGLGLRGPRPEQLLHLGGFAALLVAAAAIPAERGG